MFFQISQFSFKAYLLCFLFKILKFKNKVDVIYFYLMPSNFWNLNSRANFFCLIIQMNRYPRLREETERIITTYIREKESVNPSIKLE
jgi:hypothetical protein